jgi:hypothetical protein
MLEFTQRNSCPEPDDQVAGAQVPVDVRDDATEQCVCGAVILPIVEGPRREDVDVDHDERSVGAPAAIQLEVKIAKARRPRTRPMPCRTLPLPRAGRSRRRAGHSCARDSP